MIVSPHLSGAGGVRWVPEIKILNTDDRDMAKVHEVYEADRTTGKVGVRRCCLSCTCMLMPAHGTTPHR